MKYVRQLIALVIVLLMAGWAYAFLPIKDVDKKIDSLVAEHQHIDGDSTRGEYIAHMAGCIACHTNINEGGKPMAGGVPISTSFGTFYSPNITTDKNAGIGQWTNIEFFTAMSLGLSPEREHYFPVFPYTSYSVMSAQDLADLKAWLDTVEPVTTKAPNHDVTWPISVRPALRLWKALFFDAQRTTELNNRGSYLVNGPGHCAECHSPRNLLGGLASRAMTGNFRGPDGESVPGITHTDLIEWSVEDLELFLEVGITPSGDFTGGHMADVIEYGTGFLSNKDRSAIATYLLSEAN